MSKHTELRYPPEQTPLQNLLAALDCIGDGLESDKDKHRAVSEERVEELHDLAVLAEKEHDVLLKKAALVDPMREALEKAVGFIESFPSRDEDEADMINGIATALLGEIKAVIATVKEV